MAGKHKHIESIYRDAFANQKAKPPKSAWKNMQASLDNVRLEQLAKARLADTAIKPASRIWSRIAGKMFWPNFMHFNPLQFNIYYAGLALLGGGATIVGININSQKPEMTARDTNPRSFVEYMIAPPASTTNINLNVSEDKQTADFMEKRVAPVEDDKDNAKEEGIAGASPNESAGSSDALINSRRMPKEEKDRPVSENVASVKQPLKTMPAGVEHFAPWDFALLLTGSPEFALRPDTLGFDYKDEPIVRDLNFIEQGWYGGVIMLKQNITFMNNEVRETYQQNNKVSDFSYRIGLRLNIVRKNFMLQTGLYFASINNKFKHNQDIAIIEDDIDGRVVWPYQSDTVYRQTTHTYHNSYRYVELPLLAGLHFEGTRFATNIKTGPVVNYLTGVSADLVLTQDNKLTSVDKSYFKRPGLRWQVSVDLIYRFGDRLSFYIEPSYVHDLTNAFNDKVEMESRLSGINVGLGMYYRF